MKEGLMEVRWGFVGGGNVTEAKASPTGAFTQANSRVVAVTRADLARGQAYAEAHGIARAYATVEELCADPEIDAVFVCTPHHLHKEHALTAIAAGKHVLCEKPLTISAEDGAEVVEAAERAGVVLAVAYYRRFYPVLERLQGIVEAGTLGTLTSAQMVCRSWSIPPAPAADAPYPAGWRTRPDQAGGGALTDVGSHRLDLLFWLLGDALAVSANVERVATWLQTEDQANVSILFAKGMVGSLDQSWCSRSYRDSIVVYGTEGIATVPDLEGTRLEIQAGAATETIEVAPRSAATHRPLVADFVRALNGDRHVRCTGVDALRTTQIIELAYRAARERATLDVPPLVSP
jgi:predicted dehydrogenase